MYLVLHESSYYISLCVCKVALPKVNKKKKKVHVQKR